MFEESDMLGVTSLLDSTAAIDDMFANNDFVPEDMGDTELVKSIDEEHLSFETRYIIAMLNIVSQVQTSVS